jgi:methanogenic corrinoid protein MtbC1
MMAQPNEFLATLLRRGSSAFAGFAAAEMLESQPATAEGLGAELLAPWKAWLADRVEELAVAVSAGKPNLFAEQVCWAKSLFAARSAPVENIETALKSLRSVLAKELPEDTHPVVNEYLSSAVSAVKSAGSAETTELVGNTSEGNLAASYLIALLEGDRQKAISIIRDAASDGWNVVDLYLRVLAPAQREIGRMWLEDEINVAEEHLATATTKMVMSQLRAQGQAQPPNGKTVVAAAVPGNQHDVGIQMVADIFELHGWRTLSLGANVPTPDLVEATVKFQTNLLLLSAALSRHLESACDTIRAIRQHDQINDVKVLVGGTAFTGVADLAEQYGSDGYAADAIEALQLGSQLVGL